jgi:hypothetical protein
VGRPVPHAPASLIVGMLGASAELFDRAEAMLAERFGPLSGASPIMKFDFTGYYEPEMGANLLRKFVAFERPINPADLVEIKLWTNDLEASFSEAAAAQGLAVRRPINLDPGYVALSKLVLATTKDHAHRICLGRGVYAEVTLTFLKGAFEPMPWTYPDYRTEAYRRFFEQVRADLLARQKTARP